MKELTRMQKRLDFIYESLGGEKKEKIISEDPFVAAQQSIGDGLVAIRKMMQKKEKLGNTGKDYIESKRQQLEIENKFKSLQSKYREMENIMETTLKKKKVTQGEKDKKQKICIKFGEILKSLEKKVFGFGDEEQDPYTKKNAIKLKDLKQNLFKKKNENKNFIKFDEDEVTETSPEDQKVMEEWDKKDEKLDDKLDDVNMILDEIKVMNKDLAREIDIRNDLTKEANKDAHKLNKVLEKQNQDLTTILKKYRAPRKLCLDICMCLFIIGLISVIIMLIKNGN